MYTICLVEDETNLANVVKLYLEKEDYEVITFMKGSDAISYIGNKVDLWILDIMLSDNINGHDIIKKIRLVDQNVPVIFTSARDQEIDKIFGFELGSDDYITKPYSIKELVLRVNNILKRVYKDKEVSMFTHNGYSIDLNNRTVSYENNIIKLTSLEFDLLTMFIKNIDKCFSRQEILDIVWGEDYFGSDRVVDDLVRRLRKKLTKLNFGTVYGYGYRLS